MPIHYRCRCGNEVVLRPREGVYLLVGVLVGLTLLNTALLLFVWGKIETPPKMSQLAAEPAASDPGASHAEDPSISPVEIAPQPVADPNPDVIEPAPNPKPKSQAVDRLEPPPPALPHVAGIRLPPPPELDAALLRLLLDETEIGTLDRTLVLLAACRWGEEVAPRAADLLRVEAPGLFEAVTPGEPDDPDLILRRSAHGGDRGELAALEQVWGNRWREVIRRAGSDPRLGWATALASAGGGGPVDLVLLVDLSESMGAEVDAARVALQEMLPVILRARPSWRCGWIGYRDEVVDRTPLTADLRVLLESLDRWRCEAGADVPEALDEGLFEAFRVGGFPWRPGARHRFVVLGDAPPPYERIAGMIELARAAHESPERYEIHCLGILRELELETIPGFQELASVTKGTCRFVREGTGTSSIWWGLLAGADAPSWDDAPAKD